MKISMHQLDNFRKNLVFSKNFVSESIVINNNAIEVDMHDGNGNLPTIQITDIDAVLLYGIYDFGNHQDEFIKSNINYNMFL